MNFISYHMKHFRNGISGKATLTAVFCVIVTTFVLFTRPTLFSHSPDARNFADIEVPTRRDWDDGRRPEACLPIFEKLRGYGVLCGIDATPGSCLPKSKRNVMAKEIRMFSMDKQDTYLYMNHFNTLKRRGVYLDIATNDPIKFSNTYFYDRCLGWKGLCVEGNPKFYEPIFRERSCLLVPTCVGKQDGEVVTFALKGLFGGIVGNSYKHTEKFNETKLVTVEERCTTVETVLDRTRIQKVDYLSLDVEGHEYAVLQGIKWDKVEIGIITVEVSGEYEKVEQLLRSLGYTRHEVGADSKWSRMGPTYLGTDAIFVHKNVKFGEAV